MKAGSGLTAVVSTVPESPDTVSNITAAAEGPAAISTEAAGAVNQVASVIYPAVTRAVSFKPL